MTESFSVPSSAARGYKRSKCTSGLEEREKREELLSPAIIYHLIVINGPVLRESIGRESVFGCSLAKRAAGNLGNRYPQ